MNISTEQMFDWIDVLNGVKEDWSAESHRHKIVVEITEFLRQTRVDYFLNMTLDDPNPVRRLDLIERDIAELKIETRYLNKICDLEQK